MKIWKDPYWNEYHVESDHGGSGGGGAFITTLIIIILFIVIAISLIKAGIDHVANKFDVKSNVYTIMNGLPEDSDHKNKDITLMVKSLNDPENGYQTSFSDKGIAKLKIEPGEYVVSAEAGNYQYIFDSRGMNRMASYDYTFDNHFYDTLHFIYFRFYDENGSRINPETVKLYGDTYTSASANGDYLYAYSGYDVSGTINVDAEGYQPVSVYAEGLPRLARINVTLTENADQTFSNGDQYFAEDLTGKGEKLVFLMVHNSDGKEIYDSDISVSLQNESGTEQTLNRFSDVAWFDASTEKGKWTIDVKSQNYQEATREIIVDDDSDIYYTTFRLSNNE